MAETHLRSPKMTEIDLSKYTEWPQEFVTRGGEMAIVYGPVEETDQWFGRVDEVACLWNEIGHRQEGSSFYYLARPAPKKLSGWLNIYKPLGRYGPRAGHALFETKAEADKHAGGDRVACIDLSRFTEGEGL